MSIEFPGSTQIVSWKETLPDYIDVINRGGRELVRVEFGEDEDESFDRYQNNRVAKVVMDILFEERPEFPHPDNVEECVEISHSEENKSYFAAEEVQVTNRL